MTQVAVKLKQTAFIKTVNNGLRFFFCKMKRMLFNIMVVVMLYLGITDYMPSNCIVKLLINYIMNAHFIRTTPYHFLVAYPKYRYSLSNTFLKFNLHYTLNEYAILNKMFSLNFLTSFLITFTIFTLVYSIQVYTHYHSNLLDAAVLSKFR